MKKNKYTNEQLMRSVPVRQAVLQLSLPTLLGALMGLVYNLTDTLFISLLRDTAQIASLALAMPVTWLLSAAGAIIAAGAPSYISRKYGAGDLDAVRRCSAFALYATLGLGVVATAAMLSLLGGMLGLMGASGATLPYARSYLNVLIAFSVVNLGQGTLQGLLRAEGKTKAASFGGILGIVTNIILDPLFIFALRLGIRGAALATAMGYVVSAIYYFVKLRAGGTVLSIRLRDCRPDRAMVKDIVAVGSASALSTLIVCVPMLIGNRFAAGYGDQLLAAVGIASKVFSIVATIASGFAMGLQPFIGYNHGAGQRSRMLRGMLCSAAIGTAMCLVGEVIFALCPRFLIGLFSDDPEVVGFGARMLRYFLIYIPFIAVDMTMTTYLSATGRAMQATVLTLVKQVVLFVPLMLVLMRFMGADGMMLAQPLASLPTTALAAVLTAAAMKKDLREGRDWAAMPKGCQEAA